MSKFIEIKKSGIQTWVIVNIKSQKIIGLIYWYKPWRSYIFDPKENTIWDIKCLEEIINFIKGIKE